MLHVFLFALWKHRLHFNLKTLNFCHLPVGHSRVDHGFLVEPKNTEFFHFLQNLVYASGGYEELMQRRNFNVIVG